MVTSQFPFAVPVWVTDELRWRAGAHRADRGAWLAPWPTRQAHARLRELLLPRSVRTLGKLSWTSALIASDCFADCPSCQTLCPRTREKSRLTTESGCND